MPEDSGIVKSQPSNGISAESKETPITLEELEELIREWVTKILANIDPPPGLWKRIRRLAKDQQTPGNSSGS